MSGPVKEAFEPLFERPGPEDAPRSTAQRSGNVAAIKSYLATSDWGW